MKKTLLLLSSLSILLFCSEAFAYTTSDCENVQALANQGIVTYRNNCGDYALDRMMTRQEVAAVALKIGEACNAFPVPPINQYRCENMFDDVSAYTPNEWACRVVETLARNDVVSQNNRYFYPLRNITRSEALSMMLSAADLNFQATTYDDWRFSGMSVSAWQKPLIQYAYDNNIISSISAFGPNQNAFRRDIFNYTLKTLELCRGNTNYNNNNNNNYGNCGLGQYSSGSSCYSCSSIPYNAYYTSRGTCDWTCNSGYYKSGNTCVSNNNNTYGTYCTVGQYMSGNMCLGCTTKPSSAYYTTAGSCDWNCDTNYYRSGNTCIYNYNNNYGTTGQCGSSLNSCVSGTFYDTVDYGNTAYWNCTGTNGTAVSCSMYSYNNNYYGTTGQCGSTVNSCTSGTFYDTVDYGNTAYWSCTGSNGTAVSCNAYNYNNYGTTAQCGSSVNSCISGTFYDTTDTGNYANWNCMGTNGATVSCSTYNYNYGTTGQCSSTRNTCTVGYVSGSYDSGNYTYWNCIGSNGVSTSCNSYNNYNYGTTGQCGSSLNSCTSGTFYDTVDYGNTAYWSCTGSNGTAVSCSMYNYNNNYGTTAQCGSSVNSCISGTFYDTVDYGNTAYWTCTGTNGTSVSCNAYNYNNTYYGNCSLGQYNSNGTCYACPALCTNGYYTTAGSCDWNCNSGYYKSGNTCVSNYNNNYNNNYGNCSMSAPANSYYTNSQSCWACNPGYVQVNNLCVWWN